MTESAATSAPPAPHVDPETFAAREGQRHRADRLSGALIVLLMLCALALAGQRIWSVASGPLPPRVGEVAPAFSAATPAGDTIGLAAKKGEVVLVDFWATWCPPCVASMPGLQAVHTEFGPKGFSVLGVNQEPGQDAHVAAFMRRRGLAFPTVMDPGDIGRSWGVYSYPTSFLIGRDGRILQIYRGPAPETRLRRDIQRALGEARASR